MNLNQSITKQLLTILNKPDVQEKDLNHAFRQLAKWRQLLITNTQINLHGNLVQQGPFKGLQFIPHTSEGCQMPRILGIYEHELHNSIEQLSQKPFDCILNIGCADGYYAVGLARKMPSITVYAHDINPTAQAQCKQVAALNTVQDRVIVGGLFEGAHFQKFATKNTWLIMDIEGGENELLRPDLYPALQTMTIVVEAHDCFIPNMSKTLVNRFSATHDIQRFDSTLVHTELPAWLQGHGHLDHLIAMWEWRMGPTPWLVMTPKASPNV